MSRWNKAMIGVLLLSLVCGVSTGCSSKKKRKSVPPFQIVTQSLPVVAVGAPYQVQLQADYGTQPYQNWTVVSGALPMGITLDSATGVISGYAQIEGTFPVTVQVSDSSTPSKTTSKEFVLQVNKAEWTVLVYMNGDNNLEGAGIVDLNEMEAAGGSNTQVNIVVQLDRHPQYDTSNGNWTTCKRFYVTNGVSSTVIESTELEDLGEVNTGTQIALQNFLEWGSERFKANKYAVVFWNHGMTWQCYSQDETDNDMLEISELYGALKDSLTTLGMTKFDLLGFDMCLVGTVETVAEFYDVCSVLVASAEVEPSFGWDYENSLKYLIGTPTAAAQQLGSQIVEDYGALCQAQGQENTTLVALDLTDAENLLNKLEDVAAFLRTNISAQGVNLGLARWYVDTFASNADGKETSVDVGDLLYVLRYITTDATLQSRIDSFLSALNGTVISKHCGSWHKYATGLSVFFPKDEQTYDNMATRYADTWLAQGYSWDEMLEDYYTFASNYTPNVDVYNVQSSDSVVTPSNPVTVTGNVSGDGITDVYFIPFRVVGTRMYVYDYRRIDNPRTLPNGKTIEEWSTSPAWLVSSQWNAKIVGIFDNSTATYMFYGKEDEGYIVYGQYSPDDGITWFDAESYFDNKGILLGIIAYIDFLGSSIPISFEPTTVDELFRPTHWGFDFSSGVGVPFFEDGPALKALEIELGWVTVASGTFSLRFFAFDIFDNSDSEGVTVTVP